VGERKKNLFVCPVLGSRQVGREYEYSGSEPPMRFYAQAEEYSWSYIQCHRQRPSFIAEAKKSAYHCCLNPVDRPLQPGPVVRRNEIKMNSWARLKFSAMLVQRPKSLVVFETGVQILLKNGPLPLSLPRKPACECIDGIECPTE